MSALQKGWNDKELIELALTLLAVIAGSVAAIGAFLGASYEKQRVELELKPALFLSCEPESRSLDLAEGARPAIHAALLTSDGARWIHLFSDSQPGASQPFARCALTNYGQLPLFNMRMALTLQGIDRQGAPRLSQASLSVPGLSPSATYSFSLINGTSNAISFAFAPTLTVIRVDTGIRGAVPLFLSEELLDLEHRVQQTEPQRTSYSKGRDPSNVLKVQIKNFLYAPAVLRVRTNDAVTFENDDAEPHTVTATGGAFDSASIDPGATWAHRFTRAGTYTYICSFHPNMRGLIVVSAGR
jgi:plastocyanin